MADDPLTRFTKGLRPGAPTASASPPSRQHTPAPQDDAEDPHFSNQVRPVCVELRCHRSGLSYSIPYAHLGAIVFNFRTGQELSFTGAGLGVTIRGHDLGGIARALRLHSCSVIADHRPGQSRPTPDPRDGNAFVESIEVKVLGVPSRAKAKEDARDDE